MPLGTAFRALMSTAKDNSAWKVIDSSTLGSAASSISFTGIDTTYRMFRITAYIVKDGTLGTVDLRLNNDSGTNYDYQRLSGNSTTIDASRSTGQTLISSVLSITANEAMTVSMTIAKQLAASPAMTLSNMAVITTAIRQGNIAGRWNNTADPINRIDLISSSGNFAAGTVAVLEGVPD